MGIQRWLFSSDLLQANRKKLMTLFRNCSSPLNDCSLGLATHESKKINILFPFVGDSVGGSHISAVSLIKKINESEDYNALVLVSMRAGKLVKYLDYHDIKYERLDLAYPSGDNAFLLLKYIAQAYKRVAFYLKKRNIKIVHGNDLRVNLFWLIVCRFSKTKFVWHQRNLFTKSFKWKIVLLLASHVIVISNYVSSSLKNSSLKKFKSSIAYNPITVSFNYPQPGSPRETKMLEPIKLIYVGRLVKWKRIHDIISALQLLLARGIPARLDIIGDDEGEYAYFLKREVDSRGLSDFVRFSGFIIDPFRYCTEINAKLLVASSENEPFGRTLVEGMLSGILVLASASGAHGEIVRDNYNGYLYDLGSPSDMAEKIEKIFSNPKCVERIRNYAYSYALENFSVDTHFTAVKMIYDRIYCHDT